MWDDSTTQGHHEQQQPRHRLRVSLPTPAPRVRLRDRFHTANRAFLYWRYRRWIGDPLPLHELVSDWWHRLTEDYNGEKRKP